MPYSSFLAKGLQSTLVIKGLNIHMTVVDFWTCVQLPLPYLCYSTIHMLLYFLPQGTHCLLMVFQGLKILLPGDTAFIVIKHKSLIIEQVFIFTLPCANQRT